jgi:acyl-coenzyme A thioesterase PaaI-like protein
MEIVKIPKKFAEQVLQVGKSVQNIAMQNLASGGQIGTILELVLVAVR